MNDSLLRGRHINCPKSNTFNHCIIIRVDFPRGFSDNYLFVILQHFIRGHISCFYYLQHWSCNSFIAHIEGRVKIERVGIVLF